MSRFFPPSKPRAVEGGLTVRSKRGAIARTWWSERFIAVLEAIGMGDRLERGRSYARKGQVISLEVAAGSVTAQVQGSRARPYRVRIGVTAFGKAEWATLERELAGNAWYLLAESFDDDPFQILAWRGRQRDDLLANLYAARTDGPPAADAAEHAGPPLEDCLSSYFALQGQLPMPSPHVTSNTSLLDQVPPVDTRVRGHSLPDLLRPAYPR